MVTASMAARQIFSTFKLVVASLLNDMSVMNMPACWQFIIRRLVPGLAVYMDVVTKKSRG